MGLGDILASVINNVGSEGIKIGKGISRPAPQHDWGDVSNYVSDVSKWVKENPEDIKAINGGMWTPDFKMRNFGHTLSYGNSDAQERLADSWMNIQRANERERAEKNALSSLADFDRLSEKYLAFDDSAKQEAVNGSLLNGMFDSYYHNKNGLNKVLPPVESIYNPENPAYNPSYATSPANPWENPDLMAAIIDKYYGSGMANGLEQSRKQWKNKMRAE